MPRFRTTQRAPDKEPSIRRLFAVGAFFALCFGILISRAVAFHLKDNAQLEKVALRQYRTAVRESTMRGKILDAAGREMAIDTSVESIFANPREIQEPVAVSEKLATALDLDRAVLIERLSSRRKFVWIKRRPESAELEAVKKMEIKGISFMTESRRSYPNGSVGANVLGAVGYDSDPLGGVELQYNDVLSSSASLSDLRRDARGHLYLSPADDEQEPEFRNVELTIDKTLQYIADNALAEGVKASQAKSGTAVVVDVRTGAVLAMANVPTFDPNAYDRSPLSHWRNSVITEPYEPGSTFKVIVVSAALDQKAVTPEEIFDCEHGSIRIGRNVINDAHAYDKLSVADIIKVSSNIGTYKVVQRVGPKKIFDAIRAFGFGEPSGIDLPGETSGLLTDADRWSPVQFATIAFGQGIAATPLQMTMAFAAIANGGVLLRPWIVKRITDAKGNTVSEMHPTERGRPIGPETAKVMTRLLKRVVEEGGTGTLASSLEYAMAGKTGTAQKVDSRTGRYAKGRYYASFVGFAPADAPRIAVFVGLDDPRGQYYGGQVAAPVFREIVEATLHYLKVPATLLMTAQSSVLSQLPPAKGMEDLPLHISDEGAAEPMLKYDDGSWKLPDFTGLTIRGVLAKAQDAQVEWNLKGSGVAVRQWPQPGSLVRAGEQCLVEFRPLM